MITLIPIEQVNDAHGALIVDAFNRFFVLNGGESDGWGNGDGYGAGWGNGRGDGYGSGNGDGYGDGCDWGDAPPKEWHIK